MAILTFINENIELLKIVSSFLTSALGAWFGAKYAVKKFIKEKLLNEKHEAYSAVLNAVQKVISWNESTRAECCGEPSIGNVSNDDYKIALNDIEKFTISRKRYFNSEFSKKLSELSSELNVAFYKYNEDSLGLTSPQDQNDSQLYLAVKIRKIADKFYQKLELSFNDEFK